jgi:hypothetical protein
MLSRTRQCTFKNEDFRSPTGQEYVPVRRQATVLVTNKWVSARLIEALVAVLGRPSKACASLSGVSLPRQHFYRSSLAQFIGARDDSSR